MKTELKRSLIQSVSLVASIIVIVSVGFYLNRPPRIVSENAPSDEFSAVRAMKHMQYIAAKPHLIGTNEHLKVRNYIIEELKRMGTQPEIQIAEVFSPGRFFSAATVGNIIVKIPGKEKGKAVLLVGHYDSVESSYGASDDGAAVVTMLETIRLLQTKAPFKNDIIFLFSDGEEVGLMGAKAFIEQHPLAKDIGIVLNLEAGGTKGESIMFETSADNNWLIAEFAKAVPYPIANSVSYEIYRNMPNDTDLTPFKENGNKGLNFAYIRNKFDYHTGGDNIKNTSVESIQHHGSYAAALAQHFANIDLNNSEKGNAVYFNYIGKAFVHYSFKWITPFLILTCLVLLAVLVIGFRKKIIRPLRLLFGFFAFIIHLAIAPLMVTGLFLVLAEYYPGSDFRLLFYNQNVLLFGFVCLTVAVSLLFFKLLMIGIKIRHVLSFLLVAFTLLLWSGQISLITSLIAVAVSAIIYFLFRKPTSIWELSMGSFVGLTIMMIAVCLMIPGASFLATWPILFSLVPIGIYFFQKDQGDYSFLQIGLFLIFALPALLWFSNFTDLLFQAMGLRMAGAAVLFTVLCLSMLIPHIEIITRVKPWAVPAITFSIGLAFILYGSINLDYNEKHQKENSLLYVTNGNTGETFLSSFNNRNDEWTVNFLTDHPDTTKLSDFFAYIDNDYLKKTVKTEPLPVPVIELLRDTISDNNRLLKLYLKSGRQANSLFIQIKSDSISASINQSEMRELERVDNTDWNLIRYYAFPHEGIIMELKFQEEQKIEIRLTDIVYGLPKIPGIEIPKRPNNMMASGDRTMATKSYSY
ncbi:MAG: M20/M25/M40 family metallo-hydrolase [Draconibacterium sp.]